MKQKTILFAVAIMLVAQMVFAEPMNKQEIDFLIALERSDSAAMEKALKERTSQTNLDVLLYSILAGYAGSSFPPINADRRWALSSILMLIRYGANCNIVPSYHYYRGWGNDIYSPGEFKYRSPQYQPVPSLQMAIRGNLNPQIIKLLLEAGADMYQTEYSDNLSFPDTLFPVNDDQISIAKMLIDHGFNINKKYNIVNGYILLCAAQFGHFALVKLLVESGAKVNQIDDMEYGSKKTAAQLAYEKKETDIYNYLKQNGATWSPPSQVATAPPASSRPRQTYDDSYDYSPPPSTSSRSSGSSSSGSSSGSGWSDLGKSIADAFSSPLESGTYGLAGTNAKVSFTSIGKSGIIMYVTREGKRGTGSYSINGNTMTVQIEGLSDVYTITSKTSFTGRDGSIWVRTGY